MTLLLKVDKSNYFSKEANWEYLGASQIKSWSNCEASTLAELKGEYKREQSNSMKIGSMVHAANEGKLEEFQANHPEMFSKKTKEPLADFKTAERVISYMQNDTLIQKALSGQKEVILTAELFGVQWKIMIDSYNPDKGMFADLKVMSTLYDRYYNVETGMWENFIQHYKYLAQMALYAEIERLATGRETPLVPYLVILTKQNPPDSIILKGLLEDQEQYLSEMEMAVDRIVAIKAGIEKPIPCNNCEYCRSTKKTKIMQYKDFELLAKNGGLKL